MSGCIHLMLCEAQLFHFVGNHSCIIATWLPLSVIFQKSLPGNHAQALSNFLHFSEVRNILPQRKGREEEERDDEERNQLSFQYK